MYDVRITPVAIDDLEEIYKYLKKFSVDIADNYYNGIKDKICSLEHMPNKHTLLRKEKWGEQGKDGYHIKIM